MVVVVAVEVVDSHDGVLDMLLNALAVPVREVVAGGAGVSFDVFELPVDELVQHLNHCTSAVVAVEVE